MLIWHSFYKAQNHFSNYCTKPKITFWQKKFILKTQMLIWHLFYKAQIIFWQLFDEAQMLLWHISTKFKYYFNIC